MNSIFSNCCNIYEAKNFKTKIIFCKIKVAVDELAACVQYSTMLDRFFRFFFFEIQMLKIIFSVQEVNVYDKPTFLLYIKKTIEEKL